MNYSTESKKDGTITHVFRYWDWERISQKEYENLSTSKNKKARTRIINDQYFVAKYKRVPQEEITPINSVKDIENLKNILERKYSEKFKQREELLKWEKNYYNSIGIINFYREERKKSAPNSHSDRMVWFEKYVLNYFLNIKHLPSLNDWKGSFNKFKKWLEDEAVMVKKGGRLSYASKNHCINECNKFLSVMAENSIIEPQPKITLFSVDLVNNLKDESDVVSENEFKLIANQLKIIGMEDGLGDQYYNFYYILMHTGLRINELFGIGLDNFRAGKSSDINLNGMLIKYKQTTYGYLILEKQPLKEKIEGLIKYKPLKGKKSISLKNNRYIPIIDKVAFNILAQYNNEFVKKYNENIGIDKDQFAFFFGKFNANIFRIKLLKAYEQCEILNEYKPPHHLRHTFASKMVILTGGELSESLAKAVLGHGSSVTARYNHSYELIMRKERDDQGLPHIMELEEVG